MTRGSLICDNCCLGAVCEVLCLSVGRGFDDLIVKGLFVSWQDRLSFLVLIADGFGGSDFCSAGGSSVLPVFLAVV